ncbi:unnamed protein product [Cunninghamella blakesleeana]
MAVSSIYIFSSIKDNSTTTPQSRYQRDYTTLTAYLVGLISIYLFFIFYQHFYSYLFNINNNNKKTIGHNTVNTELNLSSLDNHHHNDNGIETKNIQINNNNIKLNMNSQYYFLRRLWQYEYRFLDTSIHFGNSMIILGLIGIHLGFILGYFTLNGQWENDYERYLDYQLRSNRTAQLALVDLVIALVLSVRTSIIWKWIGVSNLLTTLPLHKWFGRFSFTCVIYHGCYQWTKHYYRQLEKDHQEINNSNNSNPLLQDHQQLDRNNEINESMMNWWNLLTSNPRYFTGSIMGLCIFMLLFGSHPLIRMKWYGFFKFSHLIGFLGITLFGIWHHWVFFVFYIGFTFFWLIDVFLRWYQSIPTQVVDITPISKDVIRLKLSLILSSKKKNQIWMKKYMSLLPGQFVFLNFSNGKWKNVFWSHPFSISFIEHNESTITAINNNDATTAITNTNTNTITTTSNSSGTILTFYIKASGNETQYLYNLSTKKLKDDFPLFQLSAPYGEYVQFCQPKQIYTFYPVIVLVAEGIGITPWLSVLQSLWNEPINQNMKYDNNNNDNIDDNENNNCHDVDDPSIKHIYLIWTIRYTELIDPMMNDIYIILNKQSNMMTFKLKWDIYITRENEEMMPSLPTNNHVINDEHHHQQVQINYHYGRPNYIHTLESIRSQHQHEHTILGLCAHEESIQLCGNLARSKKFNNHHTHWEVKSERFEF